MPDKPRNHVLEFDRFSHTAHVWHLDDRGDLHQMAFIVPPGTRRETVAKALRYYSRRWIDKKVAEGWKPNLSSFRCYGPLPSVEFPGEDEYVVEARWYREKPLVMPAAQLEALVREKPQPRPRGYPSILAAAAARPAQERPSSAAVEEALRHRKRAEERRRRMGLPEPKSPLLEEALKEEEDNG